MKTAVIDASAVLAFILPDESTPKSVNHAFTNFAQGKLRLIAPDLLKLEISNALRSAVIKKRMTQKLAKKILNKFLELNIEYQENNNLKQILQIALKHNLSVYDAVYLELSQKCKAELLTLDQQLKQASR